MGQKTELLIWILLVKPSPANKFSVSQDTADYLKKPLILEEFGVETEDSDGDRISIRDPFFTAVINEIVSSLNSGGVLRGGMFWEWFADENAGLSRHGVTSRHSTWGILSSHAADIASRNAQPKDPFCRPGRESAKVSSYVPDNRYDIGSCCSADCKATRGLFRGTTIKELFTADAVSVLQIRFLTLIVGTCSSSSHRS